MCLIFIAIDSHPKYRLIIAANRDEYYDRSTEQASFWHEAPELLAGRDLRAGGTWLGLTRTGRIAALTNFRDPKSINEDAPSRGKVVSDFLLNSDSPIHYLERLSRDAHLYNGFNLLVGWKEEFFWYSNRGNGIQRLPPGIYGLSNHLLDTPWPKIERGKKAFGKVLAETDLSTEDLFQLLQDRTVAKDESLPDTGVGLEWERLLSPIFITSPHYGTRSSTIILLDGNGRATFMEKSFSKGIEESTICETFVLARDLNPS
jgi:uncharacterized protein with NRDE domain